MAFGHESWMKIGARGGSGHLPVDLDATDGQRSSRNPTVIPAKAGIQSSLPGAGLDPGLRRDDVLGYPPGPGLSRAPRSAGAFSEQGGRGVKSALSRWGFYPPKSMEVHR